MEDGKSDDRKGGDKEQKSPRAPQSVREGLGGDRSRRRHGRKGRRGRSGPGRGGRAAPPPRVATPPPTPDARIAATEREVDVDGVRWLAKVVGSSDSPGGPDRSVRLLEVAFEAEGEAPLGRTGYVPGVDLDGVAPDDLVRLVRRLRELGAATGTRSSKKASGGGRGSKPTSRHRGEG